MRYLETLLSGRRFSVSYTAKGIDFLAKSGGHGGTTNSSNRGSDLMLFIDEIAGERNNDVQEKHEQRFHDVSSVLWRKIV